MTRNAATSQARRDSAQILPVGCGADCTPKGNDARGGNRERRESRTHRAFSTPIVAHDDQEPLWFLVLLGLCFSGVLPMAVCALEIWVLDVLGNVALVPLLALDLGACYLAATR